MGFLMGGNYRIFIRKYIIISICVENVENRADTAVQLDIPTSCSLCKIVKKL